MEQTTETGSLLKQKLVRTKLLNEIDRQCCTVKRLRNEIYTLADGGNIYTINTDNDMVDDIQERLYQLSEELDYGFAVDEAHIICMTHRRFLMDLYRAIEELPPEHEFFQEVYEWGLALREDVSEELVQMIVGAGCCTEDTMEEIIAGVRKDYFNKPETEHAA